MKYEVIDNFLPQDQFDNLQKLVTGADMLWHKVGQINNEHKENEDFDLMFVHLLFESNMYPPASNFFQYFAFLQDRIDCKSLRRMKLNLYPHTSEMRTHASHIDYDFEPITIMPRPISNPVPMMIAAMDIDSIKNADMGTVQRYSVLGTREVDAGAGYQHWCTISIVLCRLSCWRQWIV